MPETYLFSEIASRVNSFSQSHPDVDLIKMGIGDVTRPLIPAVINAMKAAVEDLASAASFHGYGPEQGYLFLRELIAEYDFQRKGINISPSEIFVSDGAKTDTANFTDLLSPSAIIAVTDPVYPVYVDSNAIDGRIGVPIEGGRWSKVCYLASNAKNGFKPELPAFKVDVIYLCSPNNPTGTVLSREELQKWVDYANEYNALLLFDAAYEAFISEDNIPHSIYEIAGARDCAVEFRSYSKTAGFTGVRCGYIVIPQELKRPSDADVSESISLHTAWLRRQTTKFNGASYISQRGAAAIYTAEGQKQLKENISYYLRNVAEIRQSLQAKSYEVYGGVNAPYVWLKNPQGMSSWDMFDFLLTEKGIVGTPGSGFGKEGEGYFRLSGFNTYERTLEAMDRI